MSTRALLKALLAGGLTTLATAALTVHAASAPHAPMTAIDVMHLTPADDTTLSITALPPGKGVVVINKLHRPLQIQGYARN
ncbi:MAG: hypothetical protein ACP5GC_03050 [Thiomonas sp.]